MAGSLRSKSNAFMGRGIDSDPDSDLNSGVASDMDPVEHRTSLTDLDANEILHLPKSLTRFANGHSDMTAFHPFKY
jgi:hypothetical protein